jgi:broad specificity phosphatase PhoE
MSVYLVRHGETYWNRTHRLQGICNVPLNVAGLIQADNLAECFRDLRVSMIFTSPLARARKTALRIRKSRRVPVIAENDLREIDHGNWTGMTDQEIAKGYASEHAVWKYNPYKFQPRSGESLPAVYQRATSFLLRILEMDSSDNVVVVAHGVVNALLLCAALAAPLVRVWDFPQPNGSVHVLRLNRRQIVAVENLGHV